MNRNYTLDRRTLLIGLLGAAYSTEEFLRSNSRLLVGLTSDYAPPGKDVIDASNCYEWGRLAQTAAFNYFPAERNLWLAYLPYIGTFYADNWSLSRIMSTAILQEQTKQIIDRGHAFVLTEEIKGTIASLEEYRSSTPVNSAVSYAGNPALSLASAQGVWCDDNAWIMRNYLAVYDMVKDPATLQKVQEIFEFEVSNWQQQASCDPGGIPWKQQASHEANHDRNTVSNAPVAMAGYELYRITGDPFYFRWASRIYDYQMKYFVDGTAVYDHIDGDCRVDKTFWAYTYGVVIGMNRLLHTVPGGNHDALGVAEGIAKTSINTFEANRASPQPPEFVDIYFQELYSLYQITEDRVLKSNIARLVIDYANSLWTDKSVHKSNHLFEANSFNLLEGIASLNFSPFVVTLSNQAGTANIFYTAACILASG